MRGNIDREVWRERGDVREGHQADGIDHRGLEAHGLSEDVERVKHARESRL